VETEEQTLEREPNEREAFDAVGDYECPLGLSVEDVPELVKITTLKRRLLAHRFSTAVGGGWGEESRKEEESWWPVCSQV